MANKSLFKSAPSLKHPITDTMNEAGGTAYKRTPVEALAQYAVTGTFGDGYYTSAQTQLDTVKQLCAAVSNQFIAKTAIYSRKYGYMKDMPVCLLAYLAASDINLCKQVFPHVVDNGKMLRNFVQMIRSGVWGRKSLGTALKNLIGSWLNEASVNKIVSASVGTSPSLNDVLKLCHVKPTDEIRGALYAWVMKNLKDEQTALLPPVIMQLEQFRKDPSTELPNVPFELLTSTPLTTEHWKSIAKQSGWHMVRMNLNTFLRNHVFDDKEMINIIAEKLVDEKAIQQARVFPYQCLTAVLNVNPAMPRKIVNALQDVLELSLQNIPKFDEPILVCLDVSGSMTDPITGSRGSATSKTRCIDVASMLAAAFLKCNDEAMVIPFDTQAHNLILNNRDSIATLTQHLAHFGGGGTKCSVALDYANQKKLNANLVVYISDNESWAEFSSPGFETRCISEFNVFKARNPKAKLVCIDLTPNTSSQFTSKRPDVLNIGGFSDTVFKMVDLFIHNSWNPNFWVDQINQIQLD